MVRSQIIVLFQSNEEVHYEQDFYKLAWANINEPLTVMVMVHCHKKGAAEQEILGYVLHQLCFEDGKIRFDNFEYNLLDPPIKFED